MSNPWTKLLPVARFSAIWVRLVLQTSQTELCIDRIHIDVMLRKLAPLLGHKNSHATKHALRNEKRDVVQGSNGEVPTFVIAGGRKYREESFVSRIEGANQAANGVKGLGRNDYSNTAVE